MRKKTPMSNRELKEITDDYIGFQATCHSPFHVVCTIKEHFKNAGFIELEPAKQWALEKGKSYFVIHSDLKTIIGFKVGKSLPHEAGFSLFGAHTDSPSFRLRLNPWDSPEGCVRLLTQKHGGIILRSWLDRPLILAGAVYSIERDQNSKLQFNSLGQPKVKTEIRQTNIPIAVIPDLAIHLDRDKNGTNEINAETVMQAIFGTKGGLENLKKNLFDALGVGLGRLDGFELSLAPSWPHSLVGADQSLIVGPRHDDLAMVFAGLKACLENFKQDLNRTAVVAFFDAEETGSQTSSGAKSLFFRDILSRLVSCLAETDDKSQLLQRALSQSFFISADMAHAFHPSYPSKHDSVHRPKINEGIVIKENANDSYATTGYTTAYFKALCERADVPTQGFIARQDLVCGSTIGPIVSSNLACPVVDVGVAMWAMHSAAETMGNLDLLYAINAFKEFFK